MSINKLYACMETKNVNSSSAREAIYRILMDANNCISVVDIARKLKEVYSRKVSLNTIYRHLTLFTECKLVMIIQDDYKKAYYCLVGEKAVAFNMCPKCKGIDKVKDNIKYMEILETLDNTEFITIHKKCTKCKK